MIPPINGTHLQVCTCGATSSTFYLPAYVSLARQSRRQREIEDLLEEIREYEAHGRIWPMPFHPPPFPRPAELLELRPRIAPARPPWPAQLRAFRRAS